MIIKSYNDEQSGWVSMVMPETCDVASFEYNEFVQAGLLIGQWYNVRGNYNSSLAFGIMGNQVATSLNIKLNGKVNALASKQKSKEYRTEKEAAKKEHGGNKVYLGIRGNTFGFYSEEEFLIPEIDKAIPPDTPMVKPAVAPETPKQIPTEPKPVSTGNDPGKPVEEARVIPGTMAALKKILPCLGKRCSSYDFGVRTVSHAVTVPTLDATMRAYRKVALLAIGRALVARYYGVEFSVKDVERTLDEDWNRNSQLKLYAEVMKCNMGTAAVNRCIDSTEKMVATFIEGRVDVNKKVMEEYKNQRWNVESFLKYTWELYRIQFKKLAEPKKS